MGQGPLRSLQPRSDSNGIEDEAEPMLEPGKLPSEPTIDFDSTPASQAGWIVYSVCAALLALAIFRELPRLRWGSTRPLAIYSYTNSSQDWENARFLVDHGYHPEMDWLFVQRGNGSLFDLIKDLPTADFVELGTDCMGWAAVREALRSRHRRYTSFLFINSSLRGPFLPYWAHHSTCWSYEYLGRLSTMTKLVGMTYSCQGSAHVQPHLFATDRQGLRLLLDSPTFTQCANNETEEISLASHISSMIAINGYKEDVLMNGFHQSPTYSVNCSQGDPMSGPGSYFGFDLHPMETFFVRPGGGWTDLGLAQYTEWTDSAAWNALEPCKVFQSIP